VSPEGSGQSTYRVPPAIGVAVALRELVDTRPSAPAPGRWLTLRQIADDLGVTMSTVYRWQARGEPWFPRTVRLGRQVRVRTDWYADWLDRLPAR
jgi:excisionase family DNA binding protein